MLVLTRRPDEEIVLTFGDIVIRVRILSAHGQEVRVGIDAPKEVAITRPEIGPKPPPREPRKKAGG